MSASNRDPLDQALAKLPQAVTPKRDVWSDIKAQIDADGAADESPRKGFTPHWYQMAAAVLLVIAARRRPSGA